jgi:hypothetical protein
MMLMTFDETISHDIGASSGGPALSADQMIFMLTYHGAILNAFLREDHETLRNIVALERYKRAFGGMNIHQAFELYERACIDQLKACARN